jgi:co-chaperonin GroES (HSP10)
MSSENFEVDTGANLADAFPDVDPNAVPLGTRVMVQVRRTIARSKGGLILVEETKETVKWNGQVAKVVAMGPLAFKNRETGEDWPEGMWVEPGDYVRIPRWNGDRIEVPVKEGEPVTFVIFNDHEIIAKIPGNPLEVKTYIL